MSQREFRLVTDDTSALTRVEYEGGGEVPDALKGLYTDGIEARKAIKAYAAEKGREVVVNDKTQQTVEEAKDPKRSSKPEAQPLG